MSTTDLVSCEEQRRLAGEATRELLDTVSALVARYVVLPNEEALAAVTLWVLHTWALDACDATPYLAVMSDEPRSGKTRLLEVLRLVVRSPWQTVNTTPAALFRKIEQDRPTLLLDEVDAIFGGGGGTEPLRAVLNGGNRRGATITRCEGDSTREWGIFCAKVLAGIDTGTLPDTVRDRSIVVRMHRRHEQVRERLRVAQAERETVALRYTLERWGEVVELELACATPELPSQLGDRAADAWEPLLAIADFAGEQWGERARNAALTLSVPAEQTGAEPLLPSMRALLATDLADREEGEYRAWEAQLERRHAREGKRGEGFATRFNCGVCGRFKSSPAETCPYCGDVPVQHNMSREETAEFNRAHGARY